MAAGTPAAIETDMAARSAIIFIGFEVRAGAAAAGLARRAGFSAQSAVPDIGVEIYAIAGTAYFIWITYFAAGPAV
jgi:hypothetical protein